MDKAIVAQKDIMPICNTDIFYNIETFEHAQRIAKVFTSSSMVPEHFRGDSNIGNVLIAMNYARRINADIFMVLQNLYIVHGRPGVEGKLVIALVNQCGRFEPIQFKEDNNGCTAFAKEIRSGKVLEGPIVNWALVKAEGWDKDKPMKSGGVIKSKWNTMPQIMFRYRAAAFFARTYCPEVLLGMQTVEEINDFIDMKADVEGTYKHQQEVIDENANKGEVVDIDPEPNPAGKPGPQPTKTEPPKTREAVYLQCPAEIDKKRPRKSIEVCQKQCKYNNDCHVFVEHMIEQDKMSEGPEDELQPGF
jgi:hypothetical protein